MNKSAPQVLHLVHQEPYLVNKEAWFVNEEEFFAVKVPLMRTKNHPLCTGHDALRTN